MEDKLSVIYKYLSSQNIANLPATEEDFGIMMQDDEKAGKIHNYLLSQNVANVDPDFNAFSEYVGRKKKDKTVEPLPPVSSPPVEDASPAQQKSALQSKYGKDVGDIDALDYDSSLPQGYTLKDLSSAKARQAALYEKSIVDLKGEFETRAKEAQAKAETQEELDKEIEKLSDEMTKRAEALPGELERPKYIAPEDVKVIEAEVANIMQSGEAFDTKNKHLDELIKYFENMAPEDMRPKIRGELNQIIARRAMTQGGQITSFAAKTEGRRMKVEIEEKNAPIVKEWAALYVKKDRTSEETARMDDLYRQSQMYSQANRLLEKLDRLPDDQGSFVQGLSAPWNDGTIASLGISDVIDAAQQLKASKRVGNMRDTEADRAVLNVLGLYQVGQSGLGEWYNRGKGLAETIPFMAQFALSGGLPGIGSATAKKMAAEQVKRTLLQKAGKFAAKTATQAAVRTPLLTTGYQRALEGMRGTTTFDEKTGSFVIDPTTRESVVEGIAKGAFTNFTEAFFESGGEAVGKGLNILASKFGVKLPKVAPWAKAVQDRVAFNGFLGEFIEELPTGFIQGIVTEGQSISEAWKQLKEDTPDILFTTAVISGVFGGMSAPGSIANARRESRIAATIGEDALGGIDEAIKAGGRENVIKALDKVWATLPEESKTPEALKDLIKYAGVSISEQTAADFQATIANTAQVEAPAAETADTETAPVIETETTPAEKETTGGAKTTETLPETEILDNGDVLYHKKGEIVAPDPEVKLQVKAELERLNSLSQGQKVVLVEGMAFPEGTDARVSEAFAKNADMLGLHLPGEAQSYINVDNITSVEEARTVWLHESGVHGGIERLFETREAYDAAMNGVVASVGEEIALKTIEERGGNRQFYEDKRKTLSPQKFKSILGEEYLAFISNKIISDPNLQAERVLSAEELSIWQKFVKALNNAIAKVMGTPMKLSDADIANLVIDATNVAMSKQGVAPSFRGKKTGEAAALVKKTGVSKEQRDKVAITPEKSGRYADLTEDSEGNLVFFHYSPSKLKTIDPATYGTAKHGRTSRDELRDLSIVGSSFLYTKPDEGEAGIAGGVVHVIKAKPNEVYDLQKDPLNFYDEAERRFHKARGKEMAFGPNAQMAWIAQVAQDNGFKIGVASWRNGLRAQIARPVAPDETYTEQERVSGGAKTQQWKAYRSNIEKGWRSKGKGRSVHSRLTPEWIEKEESRLGNTMMTRDQIQTMLETGEYAILTGENPNNNLQNDAENRKLNKAAEKWLEENGFTPIPVVGKYDGKGELSYIVPGMTLADVRRAQIALGQEMIAHSSGMLKPGGKAMHPRVAGKVNYPKETTLKDTDFASLIKDNEGNPLVFSIEYDWNADQVVKVGTVQESIIAVSKSLGLTFPGAKIIVGKDLIQTRNQLYKVLKSMGVKEKLAQDIISGFTWNTAGQSMRIKGHPSIVIINEAVANERTAGHEMWHLLLSEAFRNNPGKIQEFAQAIDKQLRKSGYEEIADKLKMFTALYGEDGQFVEYMAELGGYLTAGGMDLTNLSPKEKTLLDRIKEIINQFAKALTGSEVFLKEATPENVLDFMVTISQKIAAGESVAENVVEGEAPPDAVGLSARRQSISIMAGVEAMKKWGLSPGKNNTRLVAEALQARQRKRYGMISKSDRSAGALKKISKWMADEVAYFHDLMGEKSGVGWYGKLYQKAITEMAEIFPELKTDQNARDLFTMLVAITSDGQKVMRNFQLAAQAYDSYRKKGRVPTSLPAMRAASIRANLKNINDLLAKHNGDIARIKAELLRVESIRKINAGRRKEGLEKISSSWPADFEAPMAASLFGPKLGMFFANLSGMENYPTLDRWWSRMFNRYRGTLIPEMGRGTKGGKKVGIDALKVALKNPSMTDEEALLAAKTYRDSYADKGFKHGTALEKMSNTLYKTAFKNINDAPFNTTDRAFMYDAIVAAQKLLRRRGYDFSIADIQAMLWYYEKNLYKKLGVHANIKGVSYSNAAKETVLKYKEAGNSFDYEIKAGEDMAVVEYADEEINETEIEVRSQKTGGVSPIASQLKDIIQRRIDKAYAIGMGEGKLVGEIEGRKGQKKEDARDEKSRNVEVRKMFREMSKFISATLKQNPFATELSNAQVRTLVNAARRVNEKNVDEFMDLVSKLVDNREYAKAIDDARQNQRAIRKRVSDGRYYGKESQKVLNFATIPIRAMDFSIEDLNKYNDVATLLLAGKVPTDGIVALRGYVPPLISETKASGIMAKINSITDESSFDDVMEQLSSMDITSVAGYKRMLGLIDSVRESIGSLSLDEEVLISMETQLDSLEESVGERANELEEEMADERAAIIEEARELRDQVRSEHFYAEEWLEVKKLMNLTDEELARMTPKQIMLYYSIMTGLTEGFVNKELYGFIQEVDTRNKTAAFDVIKAHLETGYAKIRALGDKLYNFNLTKPIAKWLDPLRQDVNHITSVINLSKLNTIDQKLLGIYQKNIRPVYEKFIAPLYRAVTAMERDVQAANNRYWSVAKKVDEEKRMLLGIIMAEMDFRTNPIILEDGQEYTWDTLPAGEQKDIFRWIIENRNGLTKYDTRELIKLREKLILDANGNIDIEANLKSMSRIPNFTALMEVSRTLLDEHKGKARVATEMRGQVWEDEGADYFPRFNRDELGPAKDNRYEIERVDEMVSPYRAVRKRAKSTYRRTHTRNAIDYNLDTVIGVFVSDVNRDYYLSRPLTAVNTALERVAKEKGQQADTIKIARSLQKGLIERFKTEMAESEGWGWLNRLISWKRTFALAQVERPVKEFTTNALRYFMRNPKANMLIGRDQRWMTVARIMNAPASLKQMSRWNEADLRDARKTTWERIATSLYTVADTMAGRIVYANEFKAAFKEKAGAEFDIDKFINDEQYALGNKEALEHADAIAMNTIETLYNTQSWVTTPSRQKFIPFISNPKLTVSKKSQAAKLLGYMQSFNFGETSETLNSILAIMRPGVSHKARAEAAWKISYIMMTNYMYMMMGGAIYQTLKAAFDDDKDIDEALSAYFSLENQWKMFAGSAATLFMGRYGNVMRMILTAGLGFADYVDPKAETIIGKTAKYTLDAADQTMNVRPVNPAERMKVTSLLDNVGLVYTAILSDLAKMGMSVSDLANKVAEEGVESLSLEQKETWLAISALNQALGFIYPNFASPAIDRVIRLEVQGLGPSYVVTPSKGVGVINGIDVLKVYDIEGLRGITDNKVTVYSSGNYESGNGALELTPKELSDYQNAAKAKFEKLFSQYILDNEMDIAIDAENKNLTYERKEAVSAEINKLWSQAKAETRKEIFQYKNFQDDPTFERLKKYGAIPDPITSISRTFNKVEVDILRGYPEYAVEVNKLFMKGYLQAFEEAFPTESSVRGAKNNDTFDATVKRIATEEAKKARDAVALKYSQN